MGEYIDIGLQNQVIPFTLLLSSMLLELRFI